jgi:hypothetical protein
MRRRPVRALVCVLLLCAAGSVLLGGTVSAYTGSVTSASNGFSAASDYTAPVTAVSVVGRSTAYDTGFIKQGATYYVYANVSDTGNPASGIASVTANLSSLTASSPAIALTAGTYSAGGTAYGYRSPAETASSTLVAGSQTYTVTATDKSGNASTASFTTVIDNTPPSATDVQSTNVSGGVVGRIDRGDTLTLTYSGTMDPYSILSGWTGAATNVQVALVDGGGTTSDYLQVYNADASVSQLNEIPVGTITLNSANYLTTGSYITFGATGAAVPSTMTRNGASITITMGTASATPSTSTTAAKMSWTPSTSATDIAGNANTAAVATQSGTTHINF